MGQGKSEQMSFQSVIEDMHIFCGSVIEKLATPLLSQDFYFVDPRSFWILWSSRGALSILKE